MLGTIIHFMIGVIFALIYAWLWSSVIGEPGLFIDPAQDPTLSASSV